MKKETSGSRLASPPAKKTTVTKTKIGGPSQIHLSRLNLASSTANICQGKGTTEQHGDIRLEPSCFNELVSMQNAVFDWTQLPKRPNPASARKFLASNRRATTTKRLTTDASATDSTPRFPSRERSLEALRELYHSTKKPSRSSVATTAAAAAAAPVAGASDMSAMSNCNSDTSTSTSNPRKQEKRNSDTIPMKPRRSYDPQTAEAARSVMAAVMEGERRALQESSEGSDEMGIPSLCESFPSCSSTFDDEDSDFLSASQTWDDLDF